jgi:hypothetical protein
MSVMVRRRAGKLAFRLAAHDAVPIESQSLKNFGESSTPKNRRRELPQEWFATGKIAFAFATPRILLVRQSNTLKYMQHFNSPQSAKHNTNGIDQSEILLRLRFL